MTHFLAANLITSFEVAREHNQIPRDVGDDDIFAYSISNVGAYFKC
jgi:hypothetical protein